MKLSYKAVGKDGKQVRGIIEAKDVNDAAAYLRMHDLIPVAITPQDKKGLSKFLPFLNKSSSKDLVFLTRQLSSMISSGLTLMQSLTIIRDQIQNPVLSGIMSEVIADIEEGKTFSSAIEKYPTVFSSIYVSLIKAGESSGLLDKILLRLADNLEKQEKLKGTIKSAMMYPIIVVIGMIIVMGIMMVFVVPQLSVLYDNLGIPLPLPTRIVVGLSNFTIAFGWLLIPLVPFLFMLYKRWYNTEAGKIVVDDFVIKIPILGKIIRETILTEFTRTFGLLVGTGTLIVESLEQSSQVAGNIHFRNAIQDIARRVEKGVSVAEAMLAYSLFPPILVQMVRIGEETGKLDESLMRVSEYFEREVDQSVKTLTTAIEPIIMVVLGVGVAFLIISIIVPIYNLTSSIQ